MRTQNLLPVLITVSQAVHTVNFTQNFRINHWQKTLVTFGREKFDRSMVDQHEAQGLAD